MVPDLVGDLNIFLRAATSSASELISPSALLACLERRAGGRNERSLLALLSQSEAFHPQKSSSRNSPTRTWPLRPERSDRATPFTAMSVSPRRPNKPNLPSLYNLPWATKEPMYSSPRKRGVAPAEFPPDRTKLKPIRMQSTFGVQSDSRKISPATVVFGVTRPPAVSRLPPNFTAATSPGPSTYKLVPAIGNQPLSPFMTASRISLKMTDDRWGAMERFMRGNMTPAPSAYQPSPRKATVAPSTMDSP